MKENERKLHNQIKKDLKQELVEVAEKLIKNNKKI